MRVLSLSVGGGDVDDLGTHEQVLESAPPAIDEDPKEAGAQRDRGERQAQHAQDARRPRIVPPVRASSTRMRIVRLPGVCPVADQKYVK